MVCGVGLLYLLRRLGALDVGPRLADALPLERLARADAQPLARMAAAWLAAGLSAGMALTALTRLRTSACALAAAGLGLVLLTAAGAASDAVESSERLLPDVPPQLHQPGLLAAVAFLAAGALAGAAARAR